MKTIGEYTDYRIYLSDWIHEQPRRGRGLRSKLAASLNCRPAYLSRVMSGECDFSPEQALRASRFMGLAESEARYFRKLTDCARAGTTELKEILTSELKELKKQMSSTKGRLGLEQVLTAEAELEYYSSWQIPVAHLALTIPGIDSRERLATLLRLPLERVSEVVAVLLRCGLVSARGGRLKVEKQLMHGDPRSPGARRHLANLRLMAVEAVQFHEPENLHYSAVVSLAPHDFEKVRDILASGIEQAADVIKQSPEQKVAVINIDWFTLL